VEALPDVALSERRERSSNAVSEWNFAVTTTKSVSYSTGVAINVAIPNQISDRLSHLDKIEIVKIE
jgi:hypothetical protein